MYNSKYNKYLGDWYSNGWSRSRSRSYDWNWKYLGDINWYSNHYKQSYGWNWDLGLNYDWGSWEWDCKNINYIFVGYKALDYLKQHIFWEDGLKYYEDFFKVGKLNGIKVFAFYKKNNHIPKNEIIVGYQKGGIYEEK